MKASFVPLFLERIDRRLWVFVLAASTIIALVGANPKMAVGARPKKVRAVNKSSLGPVEVEVKSKFSHIRVRRKGTVRTLIFVLDSGEEAVESQMDLTKPYELHYTYLRHMFLSYVLRPEQEQVLIVGLGGGSMIHFLKRYDPKVHVDAVEIDPVVVKIAKNYFGVRSEKNVNIVTEDGFKYLATTKSQYDVIYMDAFLKPSHDTGTTGVPLKLQTLRFYQSIQKKLKPGGLVVYNLNQHKKLNDDVKTIREAFPQTYVFSLPNGSGLVVVASMSPARMSSSTMLGKAKEIDGRFQTKFSFQTMARRLKR